jgi:predicted MFS family arabinose efflux permease
VNVHQSDQRDSPPDRNSASILGVITVGAAVGLSLFGDMAMYVILPIHYLELGLTAIQVGILLSANRWVRLVTNQVAERMLQRYSSKVLFPGALVLGSALAAAYSTTPGFVILLLLRMVWGLCWSFIRHTGVMTTIGIAGSRRAGRLMGVYVALLQAGFVAGTFVAGLFFDGTGFRTTFLLAAAMSLAAVPVAVIGARRSRVTLQGAPAKDRPLHGGTFSLSVRGFIVSLVGAGLIMSTLGYLLKSFFGETVPIGSIVIGIATVNGILLASQHVINGLGSPLFGILIDRHGLLRSQILGFAVSGLSLLALAVFKSTSILVPLVVVFFVSAAVARLAVESQAAVAGPRAYASLATATDLGSAVGPILGWVGIELARSGLVFWAGGGLFLVGAAVALAAPRTGPAA